jgi:hypothetical protein
LAYFAGDAERPFEGHGGQDSTRHEGQKGVGTVERRGYLLEMGTVVRSRR